jgi:hypothetical protein
MHSFEFGGFALMTIQLWTQEQLILVSIASMREHKRKRSASIWAFANVAID